METLAALFGSMLAASAALNDKREQLQLDAGRLFSDMDEYRMNYLSVNQFARWV